MSSTEYCVVYVTAGSEAEARSLADALVKEQLAACVNRVGPIESTYVWDGEVQHDSEFLLVIKTRRALIEALTARVQALHSYDLPEVIALPIVAGSPAYLEWLGQSTQES